MRRFILQVVVDTIAIFGAIVILRLFHVSQPFPFGTTPTPIVQFEDANLLFLILSGLGLTVGNVVLKPVIVAFTGRLILWSLGLFSVIITAAILYLTGAVTPLKLAIADPFWLWVLIGAAIVQLIGSALSALLGPTRPSRPRRPLRSLLPTSTSEMPRSRRRATPCSSS